MCFALNPGYIGVFVSKRAVFRKHLCRYSKGKFPSQLSIVSRAKQASMPRRTLEGGSGITGRRAMEGHFEQRGRGYDSRRGWQLAIQADESSSGNISCINAHAALTVQEGAPGL